MRYFEFYLDSTVKNRGSSGGIVFNHYDGTVSLVTTNEGGRPKIRMIQIHLYPVSLITKKLEVKITGGPKEVAEWEALPADEDTRAKFMFTLFHRALTSEVMTDLLSNALQVGEELGIEKTQLKLRELIGLE